MQRTDWFYDLLPMAITYGMSVKEFWEDSPDLFWAYRFSYFEKIKLTQEINNYNSWLQGAYTCEAVQVAINNCFNKQKIEYSKKDSLSIFFFIFFIFGFSPFIKAF